jgi:cobalt transporter subunit CbtB
MTAIATTREAVAVRSLGLAERLPAVLVMIFGLAIVYAVGFSPFTRAHNAAHDTRHANGFPCH